MKLFFLTFLFLLSTLTGCGSKIDAHSVSTDEGVKDAGERNESVDGQGLAAPRVKGDAMSIDASLGGPSGNQVKGLGTHDAGRALAVQTDGKILVAGHAHNGTNHDALLMRFNANGTLDDSFGMGGRVLLPVGNFHDNATSVALQNDGKILIAGSTDLDLLGTKDWFVARFTPEGQLDVSFDSDGVVTKNIVGALEVANSIAVNATHAYIAGYGAATATATQRGYIMALNLADGQLELGFNKTGIRAFAVSSTVVYSTQFQKILMGNGVLTVGGNWRASGRSNMLVAQFKLNGLVNVFGGNDGLLSAIPFGKVSTDDVLRDLLPLPDGKFIAVGYTNNLGNWDLAIARITATGTMDTTWGDPGVGSVRIKLLQGLGGNTMGEAIVMSPDGTKYFVTGHVYSGTYLLPTLGTRDTFVAEIGLDGSVPRSKIYDLGSHNEDSASGLAVCGELDQLCTTGASSPNTTDSNVQVTRFWQ